MEKKKIKVLFVIDFLTYGGAPKMMTEIANSLSLNGMDIKVYGYANTSYHYNFVDEVEYIPGIPLHKNFYLRHFLKVPQVRKTIKRVNPDVVISFMPNPNVLSIIGTRFLKIPVIISERGDPAIYTGIVAKIKHFFYNFADVLVCQTEGARDCFNDRIKKKTVIIPNSVTMQQAKITPIEQRRKEIAFVGRFYTVQKRQDLMLMAFKEVLKKHPEYKLVFYGDGEDQNDIERIVEKEDIMENVIFAGRVDNVADAIKNAGIFVLTSDYEGIPNALVEAMCLGLPVVATDCTPGGARLLIEDHVNGIICSRGKADEIADAIIYMIDNPVEAEKMGIKAQKIIDKFSPNKINDLWKETVENVL